MDENMVSMLLCGKTIEIVNGPNKGRLGKMTNPDILGLSDFKMVQILLYGDSNNSPEIIMETIENIKLKI